jgi:transposase
LNVLKHHLQTTLRTLLANGTSQRQIERVTGIDRKTIRAYVQRFALEQSNSPRVATDLELGLAQIPPSQPPVEFSQATSHKVPPISVSACEPYREFIESQLRLNRNFTAIFQDLVDQFGFSGAYGSVKRFARQVQPFTPEQFDRLEFAPGEEAQVDYGEGAPTLVPGTERYKKPRLFVMTLRYSRRSFRRVVWKSSQQVWASLHEQAWRYFGGATQYVVLDNLKEGVLKPDLYEPEINPVYAATLAHYGVVADPARVRDPNRKGSVENAIGHTQSTALKGKRFESIEAQNEFLEHWETKWAASRIHGSVRRQVQAMFEEERPHLKPLPVLSMQYFKEEQRTVCDDSCIQLDYSSYAARPALIGSCVIVRIFERHLEIRDLKTRLLLRTHAKADRPGTVVLPLAERLFNPSRETRQILNQAKDIGPAALQLCETLFTREGRVGQRKLWGIVGLAKRYPRRLINTACQQALDEGVLSYKQIQVLTKQLMEEAVQVMNAPTPLMSPLASMSVESAQLNLGLDAQSPFIQDHALIRVGGDYGDLFALASATSNASANEGTCAIEPASNTDSSEYACFTRPD